LDRYDRDYFTILNGKNTELEQIMIEIATIEIQDFCNQDINDVFLQKIFEAKGDGVFYIKDRMDVIKGTSFIYKMTIGGTLIRR
jgi:hypothetical protein